ncbi:MAG: helix-turn-helix transcriptional regulator [Chloroflexi bacterium]|nr:helix-turn-helix transcriptional regulator [Chloroflexota bacterium]
MHHHTTSLFESGLLRVEAFHCAGQHSGFAREECTSAHEIVVVRRGTFVKRDASGTQIADAGSALFFAQNQPYQISHPLAGGDSCVIFTLRPALLFDMLRPHNPGADARPEQPFAASHAFLSAPLRLRQVVLLALLEREPDNTLLLEETAISWLRHLLPPRATRQRSTARALTRSARADFVQQVRLALLANFRRKVSLSELAAAVHVSPFFLCRVFKESTGLTLHQYMLRLRLFAALEALLQNPRSDLTELALSLGFASHSHFPGTFTRVFGLPPSRLRQDSGGDLRKILEA